MTLYLQRAKAWFGFSREQAEAVLEETVEGAVQLANLFAVDTGSKPDLVSLLSQASEALVQHQVETQRKAEELSRQAYTDGLTGIANRKRFDEILEGAFETATSRDEPVAVLFSDADKFKTLNDTYGHQAGDAVLQQLAARLTEAVSDRGTVCRYGGEEFAVILPGIDGSEASQIAEKCRVAIESTQFDMREVGCGVDELPVTVSIGVASREIGAGSAARDAAFLLRAADKAVYAAKDAGRNCVRLIRLRAREGAPAAGEPKKPVAPKPTAQPAATPAETPIAKTTDAPAISPKPRMEVDRFDVLLVEDDVLQQRMISMPLVRHPSYEVDTAEDGAGALKAVESRDPGNPYGLILLDMGLPDMSGVEVVKALRQSASHLTVPIVVLSASEDDDDIRAALLAGANAYITKQSICDDPKARILSIVDFWTTTMRVA